MSKDFPSKEMREKYHLFDGIVLCKCGEPAMVGDKCWYCHSVSAVGIEKTEQLSNLEPKYRKGNK